MVSIVYIPYYWTLSVKPPSEKKTSILAEKAGVPQTGESLYRAKCAVCHGQLGEGGIGPNLTDNYWLHGNRPEDLLKVIREGVPDQGMAGWANILTLQNIENIRDFVLILNRTNPPHAKAPQGKEYPERSHESRLR